MRIEWDDDDGSSRPLARSCEPPEYAAATFTRPLPNVDSYEDATDDAPDDQRYEARHKEVTANMPVQRPEYDDHSEEILCTVASSEPSAHATLEEMAELDAQQTPPQSSRHGYTRVNAAISASRPEAIERQPGKLQVRLIRCFAGMLAGSILAMAVIVTLSIFVVNGGLEPSLPPSRPPSSPPRHSPPPPSPMPPLISPSPPEYDDRPIRPFAPPKAPPPLPQSPWPTPPSQPPPPHPQPPPAPPRPPRPPPPALNTINERFMGGGPSSSLEAAGVLVHSFDIWDGGFERPWLPCAENRWCSQYSDRMPATIITPGHTRYFTNGAGGFVVRPALAQVRCCYSRDGHTTTKERGCGTKWCTPADMQPWNGDGAFATCAWRADQLLNMMEDQVRFAPRHAGRHLGFSRLPGDLGNIQWDPDWLKSYNEVVLDSAAWRAALPTIIEAVFVLDGSSDEHQQRAVDARARFLHEFDLHEDDVPLLMYDPQRSPPFVRYIAGAERIFEEALSR